LMGGGKAGGGEHGSAERKRKSKDGVLPFDHFERDAEAAEEGHEKIVRQFPVFSSLVRTVVCGAKSWLLRCFL
jgi:hypothetical protein